MEKLFPAGRVLIISTQNNHGQNSWPAIKDKIFQLKINRSRIYYHSVKPLPNPSPYQGEGRRGEVNQSL